MNLTVLTENVAGGRFLAEHGLSYLIESDGHKVLFDTGHSEVFIRNAKKLGIDIHKEISTVVLSHGHWDHGDGLQYLSNKTLIAHPSAFMKRYRKNDTSSLGLKMGKQELEQKFNLILSDKPYKVTSNLYFLGEIPRITDFEAQTTTFVDEFGSPDFVPDDSALAIIQDDQLVIVTGCSHSGICNIIEYAKTVTGFNKIHSVIGGFHLKFKDRQTELTITYLKEQNIKNIYPSHCTELSALAAFYEHFGIQQLKTGNRLNL